MKAAFGVHPLGCPVPPNTLKGGRQTEVPFGVQRSDRFRLRSSLFGCFLRGHSLQIIKRINPRGMAIDPGRLYAVAADAADSPKFKRIWSELSLGAFMDMAHNIHFALAPGARTVTPQFF